MCYFTVISYFFILSLHFINDVMIVTHISCKLITLDLKFQAFMSGIFVSFFIKNRKSVSSSLKDQSTSIRVTSILIFNSDLMSNSISCCYCYNSSVILCKPLKRCMHQVEIPKVIRLALEKFDV